MNFLKTTAAAAVAVALTGAAASAATFDFAADAETFFNTNNFEGTFDQVYGVDGAEDDGVTVMATATSAGEPAHPFMDSRGNNDGDDVAGLGVCSSGLNEDGNSRCSTNIGPNTGDDNLVQPELLTLTFSGDVGSFKITDLIIRDSGHDLITDESAIRINDKIYAAVDGKVLGLDSLENVSVYTFTSTKALPEIYLSVLDINEVPVPAAGFLLLGGLGGLVAMKRRKKAA